MVSPNKVIKVINFFLYANIALWVFVFLFSFMKHIFDGYRALATNGEWFRRRLVIGQEYWNSTEPPSLLGRLFFAPIFAPQMVNTTVIVLSQYRSGATFIGQIFNVNPDFFYMFEPLRIFETLQEAERLEQYENTTTKFLDGIFHCKFSEEFAFSYVNVPILVHYTKNLPFLLKVNGRHIGSSSADVLRDMCQRYNGNVAMKIIRASLQELLNLIETYPRERLKIIHIVRDPRGVANSRKLMAVPFSVKRAYELYLIGELNAKPDLNSSINSSLFLPENSPLEKGHRATMNWYCHRLQQDLQLASNRIHDLLQDRYRLVRYEDFVADPTGFAHKIYAFIGPKPVPESVINWLDDNTNVSYKESSKNSMGVHKHSIETASNWRRYLRIEEVEKVQMVCAEVMKTLGYNLIAGEASLLDFSVPTTGVNRLGMMNISIT